MLCGLIQRLPEAVEIGFYKIRERLSKLHLNTDYGINIPIGREFVDNLKEAGLGEFKTGWAYSMHNTTGPSGRGRNKLRTYRLFKAAFETEPYCKLILPLRHRSVFAKFRCGVAPLRIETGRYENKPLEERKCPFCDEVENESHVVLSCYLFIYLYDDLRIALFNTALTFNPNFMDLTTEDKLI